MAAFRAPQAPTATVAIRPRSVLGLKYVDLHKGTSAKDYSDGGTMPITQTTVPVQFEDLNTAFNAPTRKAIQQNLVGFGNTLAGRGSSLNDTFASLPRLLGYLRPVAAYLSDPKTELTRFLRSLEGFMGAVAPVAWRHQTALPLTMAASVLTWAPVSNVHQK